MNPSYFMPPGGYNGGNMSLPNHATAGPSNYSTSSVSSNATSPDGLSRPATGQGQPHVTMHNGQSVHGHQLHGGSGRGMPSGSSNGAATGAAAAAEYVEARPVHSGPMIEPHQDLNSFLESFWTRQMDTVEGETPDWKSYNLPLARIKKVMKSDEEVRMISAEAPIMFSKACEIFISELTCRAWLVAESHKRRTLQKSDVAAAIAFSDMFDFLIDIVPRDDGEGGATNGTGNGDNAQGAGDDSALPSTAPSISGAVGGASVDDGEEDEMEAEGNDLVPGSMGPADDDVASVNLTGVPLQGYAHPAGAGAGASVGVGARADSVGMELDTGVNGEADEHRAESGNEGDDLYHKYVQED
ncbi:hypothetical protein IAU60_005980 [Kwoniella sp. DSM 27419]